MNWFKKAFKVPLPEMEKQIAELMARDAALVQAERQREAQVCDLSVSLSTTSSSFWAATVSCLFCPSFYGFLQR